MGSGVGQQSGVLVESLRRVSGVRPVPHLPGCVEDPLEICEGKTTTFGSMPRTVARSIVARVAVVLLLRKGRMPKEGRSEAEADHLDHRQENRGLGYLTRSLE